MLIRLKDGRNISKHSKEKTIVCSRKVMKGKMFSQHGTRLSRSLSILMASLREQEPAHPATSRRDLAPLEQEERTRQVEIFHWLEITEMNVEDKKGLRGRIFIRKFIINN